jgi:hypothetical protein
MNGILTIAFGAEYDKIAAHTLRYAARLVENLPFLCVITNVQDRCQAWEEVEQICNIDFICGEAWQDSDNRKYKMQMWDLTPFDKTIYIDADAVIQKEGIECIFDMLDHADFVLNGLNYWRIGDKVPNIYAKAMLSCGAKLPLNCYNGGFLAWRKGEAANKLFETWYEYFKRTGRGRDMPALACAIQHVEPLIFDVGLSPVFAPERKDPNCIIQHNYNATFFDDFKLPRFQESKPFDGDPTDFRFADFKRTVTIKSHNGIGDLLFVTPTLRRIKEAYPNCRLVVNTNRPTLLQGNPYVDEVGTSNEGVFLGYTAPDTGRIPTEHHIIEDCRIVCDEYSLKVQLPELRPELYSGDLPAKRDLIGVQVSHKRNYHGKRVWPGYEELAQLDGFEAIPEITEGDKMVGLIRKISEYKLVVCAEGGISHIAAALNMPAVVLFGGFSDPEWTGYDDHVNITSDIECKHCYNNKPCERNFECWKAISVNCVVEAAAKLKETIA